MAKGKHTTALFDVIHAAKKPPKSSPSASMPTPRWWAKDKMKLSATVPPIGETAGKQGSWLASVKKSIAPATPQAATVSRECPPETNREVAAPERPLANESYAAEPVAPEAVESHEAGALQPAAVEAPVEKPVTSVRWMQRSASAVSAETTSEADDETDETPPLVAEVKTRFRDRARVADGSGEHARRSSRDEPPVAVVDREAKEVSFRLSYAGLIGLAVIVVLAMALAFVVGGHYYAMVNAARTKPGTAIASTGSGSGSSSSGASLSAVGSTAKAPAGSPAPTPEFKPSVADPKTHATTSVAPMVTQTPTAPPAVVKSHAQTPVPAPAIDDPRIPGRMYVIIKSYPEEDGDAAAKTAAVLNANGVSCSVVRGFNGFVPHGSYSVVGYQPFKSVTDPDCIRYGKKLDALRPKFAGASSAVGYPPKLWPWAADSEQG